MENVLIFVMTMNSLSKLKYLRWTGVFLQSFCKQTSTKIENAPSYFYSLTYIIYSQTFIYYSLEN